MDCGPSNSPIISPPSRRVTIPNEVISIIAGFADRSTLVSIAAVSRSLRRLCQTQVWSKVYLPLPAYIGMSPAGSSTTAVDVPKRVKPHSEMTGPEWVACGAAFRGVIRNLLMAGPEQRWRTVRAIKMAAIPGALHDLIAVLGLASPNLQVLELVAGRPGVELNDWDYIDSRFRRVMFSMTFPLLHTIHIGKGSIRCPEFIPYLCTIAPRLYSLTFELDDGLNHPPLSHLSPELHGLVGDTKLRQLRACFTSLYTLLSDGVNIDVTVPESILSLFRHSPAIRQLALSCDDHPDLVGEVLDVICGYEELRDLNWTEGFQVYLDSMTGLSPRVDAFTALRRTVLDLHHWADMFDCIPQLPNLEMLYFRPFFLTTSSPLSPMSTPQSPACRMIPAFHRDLINAPRLRIIHIEQEGLKCSDLEVFDHMDELERNGGFNGFVRSIKHGSSEVLHARLLMDYVEGSDEVGKASRGEDERTVTLPYTSFDHQGRVKVFEKLDEARWQNLNSYRGEVLPMEVLDRMMDVEGQVEGGWDRRGVEVGNAAWQVLLAWFDRSREEELAESESCI